MGTRCQIGFYEPESSTLVDFEALIYRHWDGDPESVLPTILPILRDFNENRGLSDIEYASAWLVAKLKENYLNIGICRVFHSDIEWFYAVYPDKVVVYQVTNGDCEAWRKFKTVKI
ncbi:hypothetical protein ES703_31966 [subsurface metagenome]